MSEKWELTGTYFEACNCNVGCSCVFLSAPTNGDCKVLVAWHINKGKYAHTQLDGLNVALAIHSPGSMLEVKWRAAMYIDENASAEQKESLTQIYTGQAGGMPAMLGSFIGEMLGIKSAPILYEADNKHRRLTINSLAGMEIDGIGGQNGADVSISNAPLCVAPGEPMLVAKSNAVHYKDYGLEWEFTDTNGFYSAFSYEGN